MSDDPAATIASLRATADAIQRAECMTKAEFPELVQELTEAAALIEKMAARDETPEDDPCSQALDELWRDVILKHKPTYGDWEYPAQAYRHLLAEFDDLRSRISVLEREDSAELLAAEQQAVANCDEVLALRAKVAALEREAKVLVDLDAFIGLHERIDILYVGDGFEVELKRADSDETVARAHGDTLTQAIRAALARAGGVSSETT